MTMTDLELLLAGVLLVALTLYVLTGGADFGAGVWSLLATGPRGTEQRRLIDRAIAPIWEANRIWLILVVTVPFTKKEQVRETPVMAFAWWSGNSRNGAEWDCDAQREGADSSSERPVRAS
jgi:hypothetical protein